jgi:TolA-binding protein
MKYGLCVPILLLAVASSLGQTSAPAALGEQDDATTQPVRDQVDIRRASDTTILEQFLAHLNSAPDAEPAARNAIEDLWKQRKPEDDPRAFMTSAMAILSKPYKTASDAMDAGNSAGAIKALEPVIDSPDFYLSTHAAVLTARALVEQDWLEDAQKVLERMGEQRDQITKRTFLAPEMIFLLGYCRLANLDYEAAATAFQEFENRFPDAPDQYRLPVRQMMQELAGRKPDGLGDVSDLMGYAGRQLRHARTGEVVLTRQERAVELLSKLIEDAEQREQQQQQQQSGCKQCGGKGCSKCKGGAAQGNQQQPQRGAERSTLPPGQGRVGDLHTSGRARPGEQWGRMRPEERERVLQALRQNYPSRYRQLVEQYYKQLSKEE